MEKIYAILPYRVKVAFIDAIVLVTFMYGTSDIFGLFEQVPDVVRAIAAIFIFLLYDPLFTSLWRNYWTLFLRDRSEQQNNLNKNISLGAAIARFLCKFFLGCISLLTVSGNEKSKHYTIYW